MRNVPVKYLPQRVFLKFVIGMKKASATENTEFTEIFKGFSQSSLCALPKGIGTMCGKERVKKQLLSGL